MHDAEDVIAALGAEAALHPYRYVPGGSTEHKREAHVPYSYDDCIAGCVIRQLEPEIHREILEFEMKHQQSFSLTWAKANRLGYHPEAYHDIERLISKIQEAFTEAAYHVLSDAQGHQDTGQRRDKAVQKAVENNQEKIAMERG